MFHGEDEEEGVSSKRRRMSIEYSKHGLESSKMGRSLLRDLGQSLWSQSGCALPPDSKNVSGKLIVRYLTAVGEGKPIREISEEEAICKICSVLLKEDDSAFMTACGCDLFLVHENCKLEKPKWGRSEKCCSCHQVFKYTNVTVSRTRSINFENKSSTKSVLGQGLPADLLSAIAGWAPHPDFKNVLIKNEFGGKLIVRHKTEIGEGKRISEIPEEEAICEICSVLLKEDNSALMTACGCDSFLVHENCKLKTLTSRASGKCYSCHQVFKDTVVALSRSRSINVENKSSTKRYEGRISNMFEWSKRA